MAPIGRVEELAQALGAGRHVRGDRHVPHSGEAARPDGEPPLSGCREGCPHQPLDPGKRGSVARQGFDEARDGPAVSLDLDHDAAGIVGDEAGQPEPGGDAVNERPEADSLDDTLDPDPEPHGHARLRVTPRSLLAQAHHADSPSPPVAGL